MDTLRERLRRSGPAFLQRRRPAARPRVERLEERCVLSPSVLDPNLGVRTVVGGLTTPTSMAFLGANDFFVSEKNTGKVQHVINGVMTETPALDLAVNFASE